MTGTEGGAPGSRDVTPPRLRWRIVEALRLAPMTAHELSRCLCRELSIVCDALSALQCCGKVTPGGWRKRPRTRPEKVWHRVPPRSTSGAAHG